MDAGIHAAQASLPPMDRTLSFKLQPGEKRPTGKYKGLNQRSTFRWASAGLRPLFEPYAVAPATITPYGSDPFVVDRQRPRRGAAPCRDQMDGKRRLSPHNVHLRSDLQLTVDNTNKLAHLWLRPLNNAQHNPHHEEGDGYETYSRHASMFFEVSTGQSVRSLSNSQTSLITSDRATDFLLLQCHPPGAVLPHQRRFPSLPLP
jgi:hypothetical protein